MKESYENIKFVLNMIQYEKYSWHVSRNLKVIVFLFRSRIEYINFAVSNMNWTEQIGKFTT